MRRRLCSNAMQPAHRSMAYLDNHDNDEDGIWFVAHFLSVCLHSIQDICCRGSFFFIFQAALSLEDERFLRPFGVLVGSSLVLFGFESFFFRYAVDFFFRFFWRPV